MLTDASALQFASSCFTDVCWQTTNNTKFFMHIFPDLKGRILTLLHSEWPKLHRVLAVLSAIGLMIILRELSCFCIKKDVMSLTIYQLLKIRNSRWQNNLYICRISQNVPSRFYYIPINDTPFSTACFLAIWYITP